MRQLDVLADGSSCRTQIAQGTGWKGIHVARILRSSLRAEGAGYRPREGAGEK